MTKKLTALFALPLALACTSLPAHAPLPATGQFVTQLGVDTLALERYTRTADRLEGDVVLRSPRVRTLHYSATLGPDGQMTSLAMSARRPGMAPTAPPTTATTITFGPTTTVETTRNGQRDTVNSGIRTYQGVGVPTIPTEPPSYGLYEQILSTHPIAGESVALTQIGGPNLPMSPLVITRRGSDSVAFSSGFFPGTPWVEVARVEDGRIVGMNSMGTTIKTLSHRDDNFDFNRVVSGWVAQEAAGAMMGQASTLDTARATIGGANLEVVYSRPSRRGRVIFGSVVPWGEVWRTGANAATQLTTSADLAFGNTVVPAGKYTLFTLPTATGATLIISSQTGQWGTDYDPKRDVARLDLTTTMLSTPVERFTISIDPSGGGGTLRLAWADRAYAIPFAVR